MGALSPILRSIEGGRVAFWCPGCDEAHQIAVDVAQANGARWSWNGSADKPTFSPSIMVTSGHYVPWHKPGDPCWCSEKDPDGEDWGFGCGICHSFVVDGRIQFLSDCTHALAGQTVDIPAWPEGEG